MITIIDTYARMGDCFENARFSLKKWEAYVNAVYPCSAQMFLKDMDEMIQSGACTFEKDILPVINAVYKSPALETLHASFLTVTDHIGQRVRALFGREPDVDIVLYLGLCNGAGWVTKVNGAPVILLGVEKIIELNWCNPGAMRGLIDHELGHAYHAQYGNLKQRTGDNRQDFVWQLFTEGIAMYFEQALASDSDYYHQDVNGWKAWCEQHFAQILADFDRDITLMTRGDQRYFGDWCDYHGHGDVGYYLGGRFVRWLTERHAFDDLIAYSIARVYELYLDFIAAFS